MRTDDELVLGADPDAAGRARRHLRAALRAAPSGLVADAELVVTELVTNAQLHGVAPVRVRAGWEDPVLRVEVQDGGGRMPVVPAESPDAMTGRGLALVGALSTAWGVEAGPGGTGKTLWAELGAVPEGRGSAVADADAPTWDVGLLLPDSPGGGDERGTHFTVRLGAVPTDLLLDAKRHVDNVVRELTFARTADGLPASSAALIETVTTTFAGPRDAIKRQALAAAARGDDVTDLVLSLPASAAAAGERYLTALDEADRWSRAARLLTLESPPLHRLFRGWYVQALVDQLRAQAAGRDVPATRPFVRVLSDEVVALSALRETADRLSLLQRVNSDLTGARTHHDIAAVVVRHATTSLGALAAMVFLADGDVLRAVHAHGSESRWVRAFGEVPVAADLPGAVAFRTGEHLVLRNLAQMTERFPVLGEVYDSERVLHVVPLVVDDHRLGIISLSFPPGGDFDEDTQTRFVRALADALAQALERASALSEAAAAADRLAFLADASLALTASLDVDQTVGAVTGVLVPRLADWCSLALVQEGALVTVGVRHADPDKTRWAEEISRRYPVRIDAPHGVAQVLRSGVAELHAELTDDVLAAAAVDAEHLDLIRQVGVTSSLSVPLPGRQGGIGVLSVVYAESGRRYTQADVAYLEDVARRAALALETARVLRDQSGRLADVMRVAEAAQHAILAAPPPTIGPVALAARYCSAAAEALVGGDLYETVARDGAVRLLIGDVRGKGLTAVRTATIVLGEFRGAAADLDDLGQVARQIDRRVRCHLGDEDFVTALIAEVRDDGGFSIASCGHPPALLAGGGRITELDTVPTLPLGLGADPVVLTGALGVGDRLLLYTDGVLEARDARREFVDLAGLVQPLLSHGLDEVLDVVLAQLHSLVGRDLGDDLALVVAEYRGA